MLHEVVMSYKLLSTVPDTEQTWTIIIRVCSVRNDYNNQVTQLLLLSKIYTSVLYLVW